MSDEPYSEDYPNEIDLGKECPDYSVDVEDGDERPMKTCYPSLYISGVKGCGAIPDEGWALVKICRASMTTRKDGDDSCEIEVQKICLPDSSEYDSDDLAEGIAKMIRDKGAA